MAGITFHELVEEVVKILGTSSTLASRGSIRSEAEQIVRVAEEKVSGRRLTRSECYLSISPVDLSPATDILALEWARSRASGKILQHITQVQFFYEHEYEVNEFVLVPRPETETLVRLAIQELESLNPANGMEVGIGSGIISIELLSHFPGLTMTASELVPQAKECALRNSARILGSAAQRLKILDAMNPSEVMQPFQRLETESRFDFLISNPPYLRRSIDEVDPDVWENEPALALFAPEGDPLFFYREVAHNAPSFLKDTGVILLEVPHERAENVLLLFESSMTVELVKDLNDKNRVLIARRDPRKVKR